MDILEKCNPFIIINTLKMSQRNESIYQAFMVFCNIMFERELVKILYYLWWINGFNFYDKTCGELPTSFFVDFLCKWENNKVAENIATDTSNVLTFLKCHRYDEVVIRQLNKPIECFYDVLCLVKTMMSLKNRLQGEKMMFLIQHITQLLVKRGFISFCSEKKYVSAKNKQRLRMIYLFFDLLFDNMKQEVWSYSDEKQMDCLNIKEVWSYSDEKQMDCLNIKELCSYSDEKEMDRLSVIEHYLDSEYKRTAPFLPKSIVDIYDMIKILRQKKYINY